MRCEPETSICKGAKRTLPLKRRHAGAKGNLRGVESGVPTSIASCFDPVQDRASQVTFNRTVMQQYIVDAFTHKPFSGNPAAVCVLPSWPDAAWMQNLAMENSLSETAFLVPEGGAYRLRWFTPEAEVGLCGHATLASAFVVLEHLERLADRVEFLTVGGTITAVRRDGLYTMDFPLVPQEEVPVTEAMAEAFGVRPLRALLGCDLVCVFADEGEVWGMQPRQPLLKALPGRGQHATAACQGKQPAADCVSRSFFPKLGIVEDPVCGSAHCQIVPYWGEVFQKDSIRAYQASRRGGFLQCRMPGNGRVLISGHACLVAIDDIQPAARPH